jgi:uncharacterized protein
MYTRELDREILAMASHFPVVTVVGPRQAGKTKLVRHLFPEKTYVNLERQDERSFALSDPVAFLERYSHGAIIDEIQRAPELLSYIQAEVDENNEAGRFILTGSHQLKLHDAISQSLAGRTAILKLLPMSIAELNQNNIHYTDDDHLFKGGYPKLQIEENLSPTKYYSFYCQTYLEKDVREIINVKNLSQFQRFMRLCAARVGCPINASKLAAELGMTTKTAKEWLSVLEASYLIFFVPPYFKNYGKRITKTPRLYFSDVGLASYLLGIESTSQLSRDPARGRLFENLVILELLKTRYNNGLESNLYFYRDKNQFEVDIICQQGHKISVAEIKSGKTFREEHIKNLVKFKTLVKEDIEKICLIYAGDIKQKVKGVCVLNYHAASKIISLDTDEC